MNGVPKSRERSWKSIAMMALFIIFSIHLFPIFGGGQQVVQGTVP